MPKPYSVTLYKNTGFNTGNIPDSPSVLSKAASITTDAVFKFQSRSLGSIRVKADWDTIKDVDYCALVNGNDKSYYVVTGVAMLSNLTAELQLTLDPINTAGGVEALTIVGGWAKRAHVSDDTLFSNILPEPWAPSNRLIIRSKKVIHDDDGMTAIVVSTCNISRADEYQAAIAVASDAAANQAAVVWPQLPTMANAAPGYTPADGSTVIFTEANGTTHEYEMPGLYAFGMNQVLDGINAVRSVGIESAIQSMYVIPTADVTIQSINVQDAEGNPYITAWYKTLTGNVTKYGSEMPYLYKSVNNKKAVCLYSGYVLTSLASGDSKSYSAHDLYAGGDDPDFVVTCDPSPDGTIYCQPTYYEGAATQKLEQAVASTPWYNAGYTYNGSSGAAIMQMNAARARNQMAATQDYAQQGFQLAGNKASVDALFSTIPKIANAASSVIGWGKTNLDTSGMISDVGDVLKSVIDYNYTMKNLSLQSEQSATDYGRALGDNIFNVNVAANVTAPELAFPVTVSAANYFGHSFMIAQTTLTDNDLARFDKFLTMYGYAVDKALTASDLTNRVHFNYILATDAVIKCDSAPQYVMELIAATFAAGIRIWHELPNSAAYNSNPIG